MTQAEQFFSALGFGVVFFAFLAVAFFLVKQLDPVKYLVLRIMTALFGAITAGLFTGAATVKYDQNIPGGHLTVSGVAGFAVCILVWLRFPDLVTLGAERPPDTPAVNFHVPAGWTFQQAIDAVAQSAACTVDYSGLTGKQLGAPMRDFELHAPTLQGAVLQMRNITAVPGTVPSYDVLVADATVHLKAKP